MTNKTKKQVSIKKKKMTNKKKGGWILPFLGPIAGLLGSGTLVTCLMGSYGSEVACNLLRVTIRSFFENFGEKIRIYIFPHIWWILPCLCICALLLLSYKNSQRVNEIKMVKKAENKEMLKKYEAKLKILENLENECAKKFAYNIDPLLIAASQQKVKEQELQHQTENIKLTLSQRATEAAEKSADASKNSTKLQEKQLGVAEKEFGLKSGVSVNSAANPQLVAPLGVSNSTSMESVMQRLYGGPTKQKPDLSKKYSKANKLTPISNTNFYVPPIPPRQSVGSRDQISHPKPLRSYSLPEVKKQKKQISIANQINLITKRLENLKN